MGCLFKLLMPCTLLLTLTGCFTLFEKDERLIGAVKSPKGKVLKFYFVALGATTNDVIQVRRIETNGDEVTLKAYERNFIKSTKFLSNHTLQIILADTLALYGLSRKSDTVSLDIDQKAINY